MNQENDLSESSGDEPDLAAALKATQEGTALAIFALAEALKKSTAVDVQGLSEKVERIIKHANPGLDPHTGHHFLLPLKQVLWAMSDRSAAEELRIFGDLKVNRPVEQ